MRRRRARLCRESDRADVVLLPKARRGAERVGGALVILPELALHEPPMRGPKPARCRAPRETKISRNRTVSSWVEDFVDATVASELTESSTWRAACSNGRSKHNDSKAGSRTLGLHTTRQGTHPLVTRRDRDGRCRPTQRGSELEPAAFCEEGYRVVVEALDERPRTCGRCRRIGIR